MKTTEVRLNLTALEDMKRAVGDTYRARVGVLGGAARQDAHLATQHFKNNTAESRRTPGGQTDISNAELMLLMVFGVLSRNIPARDPLFTPIIKHRRELMQAIGSGSMRAAFAANDYVKMFRLLGIAGEAIVQQAFETSGDGTWPPNAPSTIAAKGSSKPDIDTAQLRKSVTSDVVKKGADSSQSITGAPAP